MGFMLIFFLFHTFWCILVVEHHAMSLRVLFYVFSDTKQNTAQQVRADGSGEIGAIGMF